ncbi:Hypothetical predicted protein [Olea europaea subsp. europaea]|uniref:Uncharacterized protein n=1 Tax=Olea europaea subsp. europaea TaxID=158383 RepID=A0A8S0S7D7_OLEEU|nr:Hypothetical predicted protein [Olea europaea subsp. europaea]
MPTTPSLSKGTTRCCGGGNFGNGGIDAVVLMEVVGCDDFLICGSLALVVAIAALLRCLLLAVVVVVGEVIVQCWLCCGGGSISVGFGGGGSDSIVAFAVSCDRGKKTAHKSGLISKKASSIPAQVCPINSQNVSDGLVNNSSLASCDTSMSKEVLPFSKELHKVACYKGNTTNGKAMKDPKPVAHKDKVQAGQISAISNEQQEDEQDTSFTEVVNKKGKNQPKGLNAGTRNQQTAGMRNQQPATSDCDKKQFG